MLKIRFIHIRTAPFFLMLVVAEIFFNSCGGRRKVDEDIYARTDSMPEELIANREAKHILLQWLDIFSDGSKMSSAFNLISPNSKKYLGDKFSIHDADQFSDWLKTLRSSDTAPFNYSISRIDIQDVNISGIKATITASYQIRDHDKISDEVGSFFLQKKDGIWVIPFCESSDYITSWWDRGLSFASQNKEEGLTTYRSEDMGIQISYPQTWDLNYPKTLMLPLLHQAINCMEISYIPETEPQPQIFIRIGMSPSIAEENDNLRDTTRLNGLIFRVEKTAEIISEHTSGICYVLDDQQNKKSYIVYAYTSQDSHIFDSYKSVIDKIIHSIQIIHPSSSAL